MTDKIFPIGLYVNPPRENAPDFVKGSISIQKDKFGELFEQIEEYANDKGYCRFNILEGKDGKWYSTVDTYKPIEKPQEKRTIQDEYRESTSGINLADIPF